MGFINNVNVDVRGAAHIAPCTYKTIVLKQNVTKQNLNVLTQDMLDEYGKNTKFVIKWDYILSENITVPVNCVLEFNGGSISGDGTGKDTITGNNTGIEAGLVKIFNTNVKFGGTWIVEKWLVNWWGVIGDNTGVNSKKIITNGTDNSSAFAAIFSALLNVQDPVVFFPKGNYAFQSAVEIQYELENIVWGYTNNIVIEGSSRHGVSLIFNSENAFSFKDNTHNTSLLALFTFRNLSLYCGLNPVATRYTELVDVDSYTKEGAAISVTTPLYGCQIDNVFFSNWHTAIYFKETYGSFKVSNCYLFHCVYGVVADYCNLLNIENVVGNTIYQAAFYIYNCKECVLTECLTELRPEDDYITHFRSIGFVTINSGDITFNTCYTERVYLSRYIKNSSVIEINPKLNGIIRQTNVSSDSSVTEAQAEAIINAGITFQYTMEIISTYNSDSYLFTSSTSYIINPIIDLATRIKCNVVVTGDAATEKSVYYNGQYYYLTNVFFDLRNNIRTQLSINTMFGDGNAVPFVNDYAKYSNDESYDFLPSTPPQKIYGGLAVQGNANSLFGTKPLIDFKMCGVSGQEFNDCKEKGLSYLFTRNGNTHFFSLAFKEVTESATNLYEYCKYTKFGIVFNKTLFLTKMFDDQDLRNFLIGQQIEVLVMYADINIITNLFGFPSNLKEIHLRGGKFINNTQYTKNLNLGNVKIFPSFSEIQIGGSAGITFPQLPAAGTMKWDTTNNKPVWSNGTAWVDATGTPV